MLFFKKPIEIAAPIAAYADREIEINSKTALVVPIYYEDPERVAARIEVIYNSLAAVLDPKHFAVFVLSDTQDAKQGAKENKVFSKLRGNLGAQASLTYRRRSPNAGRKAGNIMDFCDRWGSEFEFMVVLDADSIMSGLSILRLIRMIQENPKAAVVQTVPRIVFAHTLFARCMQFGHRLAGELLTAGASFWQLGSANYYGHNAIIRVAPFAKHCRLPVLEGTGVLSGEIWSHDFVEAAYLRRAGYEVWDVPDGEGSFEEMPTNIIDYAKRDKRWCQGNLQHARVMVEKGLHPVSRFHFFQGIMAYVSSLLWLVVIILALVKFSYEAVVAPVYFEQEYQLFPIWPEFKTEQAVSLFCATLSLLLAPKIFGLIIALLHSKLRREFGGGVRLTLGLLAEALFSTLIAPVMMIFNTQFVISILTGRGISWGAQARDARGLGVWEAVTCLKLHMIVGILMSTLVLFLIPEQFVWISPILVGLCFSVFLAVVTSHYGIGEFFRKIKLFSVPEENSPTPELKQLA